MAGKERLTYRNTKGESIIFGQKPPFLLFNKEGFEKVETIVTTKKGYGQDGEAVVSVSLDSREMKLDGAIEEADHEEMLRYRRTMNRIFNPNYAGTLTYETDIGTYEIDCIPITPLFDEGNRTIRLPFTVNLFAADPKFRDTTLVDGLIPLSTIEPLLTWPLEIVADYQFARAVSGEIILITNNGDVPTGGLFRLQVSIPVTNPRIYNVLTQEFFGFTGVYPAGTLFEINTVARHKYVRKYNGTAWVNAMSERMTGSTFLQINEGDNYFQIQADAGVEGCLGDLTYTPLLIGV